jgi:hypothetical protein
MEECPLFGHVVDDESSRNEIHGLHRHCPEQACAYRDTVSAEADATSINLGEPVADGNFAEMGTIFAEYEAAKKITGPKTEDMRARIRRLWRGMRRQMSCCSRPSTACSVRRLHIATLLASTPTY